MNLRYSAKQFQAQLSTLVLVFLFPLSSVLNLRSSPPSPPARAGAQARITLTTVLVVVPVNVTDAMKTADRRTLRCSTKRTHP